jgi:glycosyltransferase involved in cell wall biosynthesis
MSRATSVIIPCYNGEEFLREALDSVRAQTVPVHEVLLIDDGSTVPLLPPHDWDGSPLRLVRTPNRGPSTARNTAARLASGEFLAFLDADDLWHPEKVARQEAALRAAPEAVASYTRCSDEPGFFAFGPYPPPEIDLDEFVRVMWYNNFFPPSSVMVRREAYLAVGGFAEDLRVGEDIDLWLRLLERGSFIQVPEPLCRYRQHAQQTTASGTTRLLGGKRARAVMIAHHRERLVRAGIPPDKLWHAYRNDILLAFYRRQFSVARPALWDYWRDHPGDLRVLSYALVSLLPAPLVVRVRGRLASPQDSARVAIDSAAAWNGARDRATHALSSLDGRNASRIKRLP